MKKTEDFLFKNTSKMDLAEMTLYQSYAMKKTNILIAILFALIFVGVGVGICFIQLAFGIIIIVCGLLGGFVLLPYLMKDSVKKQNIQSMGDKTYLNTFLFYDDGIQITSEESLFEKDKYKEIASQKVLYEEFLQAVLYKDRLFLYVSSRECFIVNFKGMTKGTIAEVIELIKEKGIKVIDKIGK